MSINTIKNDNNVMLIEENIDMIVLFIKIIVVVREKNINLLVAY